MTLKADTPTQIIGRILKQAKEKVTHPGRGQRRARRSSARSERWAAPRRLRNEPWGNYVHRVAGKLKDDSAQWWDDTKGSLAPIH